jgi:hypothetical protein
MYLVLYVVTLAVHVLFMNYVLAGSCYLGLSALVGSRGKPQSGKLQPGTIRDTLVDWLPFAVGLAITAGVAPLLFLQILYEKSFYTANLLLFHRWMLIVPALIVGFYLLYLSKSDWARERPWAWRGAAVGAFLCFAFTAWSWTENHLLSRDHEAWTTVFASGQLVYRSGETLPRLAMWFLGSASTLAMALGWQLRTAIARGVEVSEDQRRRVAQLGLGGLVLGGAAAAVYTQTATVDVTAVVAGPMAMPYTVVTGLGAALQIAGWLIAYRRGDLPRGAMVLVTAGLGLALVGSGVVRESVRIAHVDLASLYPQHALAAESGGFGLFVGFLFVNAAVAAFAIRLGLQASRQSVDQTPTSPDSAT